MREIVPQLLWIGNARDARAIPDVLATGITAVIDLAAEEPPIQFPRDIIYCRFPILDGEGNVPEIINSAIDVIVNLQSAQIPTLVACSTGMSRSPAVVSAVLAIIESIPLAAAIDRIAVAGPCDISPGIMHAIHECLADLK